MRLDVDRLVLVTGDQLGATRRDFVLIAVAVLLAAAVRLVFFGGIYSPDELNTLRNAAGWWTGRFELKDAMFMHDTRPLMFVPVAWCFTALGVSEATALLWPFLASLGVIVFVYLIAQRLFGRETAAYAAFCAAFFPLLAQEATRLLPGVVMNLLIGLCAFCFVVSERAAKRRWVWLTGSGMAYGAIQMAGELGIVLVCFFLAAVILWRRHPLLSYWPVAAGLVLVTALIGVYQWVETGNPLFKLALSKQLLVQIKTVAPHQPLYYAKVMLAPFSAAGGVFYLAGVGCVGGLLGRRREPLFVALWIATTWALIEFGSVSLTEYRQLSKEVRYLSVVSVPTVILAGYGMAWIREVVGRCRWRAPRVPATGAVFVVSVLVAILCLWTLQSRKNRMSNDRASLGKLREHARRCEGKPIYVTHWLWNTQVGYFMRFEDEYFPSGYDPYHAVRLETADSTSLNRYVQTLRPGEPMGPGLLLHDERLFEVSEGKGHAWSVGRGEIPEVLAHVPAEWRLVERVAVGERFLVALYDIPGGAAWPATVER